MRPQHVLIIVLALVSTGCPEVLLLRLDGGSSARDSPATPDATSDTGAPDAGFGEILYQEDFETDPLDPADPRWTITNIDSNSWYWHAPSGTLRSGPGDSCVYWGTRPGSDSVFCDAGPAMIHSRRFPATTGDQFTMDFDVWTEATPPGRGSSLVWLHQATDMEPGWRVLAGEPEFTNQDYLTWISFVPISTPHVAGCPAWRFGRDCPRLDALVSPGVWYHMHVAVCGATDGLSIRVTERDTGTLIVATTPPLSVDVSVPGHYSEVFVQLAAEGPEKAFDNVVVRRGCSP